MSTQISKWTKLWTLLRFKKACKNLAKLCPHQKPGIQFFLYLENKLMSNKFLPIVSSPANSNNMFKRIFRYLLPVLLIASCTNNKTTDEQSVVADSAAKSQPAATEQLSSLPPFVIYRNWEQGDAENSQLIINTYKAWDSDSTGTMSSFFGDTTRFDLPDGRRFTTTNSTIESTLRKWRKNYKETTNIPFSLISLHNKDLDQQWVIAWTWNKWSHADGSKDSMLYCDNWRLKDGKIVYLNSLENRPSRSLSKTLNTLTAK
jgi:hypothetical protein